ncbi:MAG: MFS transporter [Aliidongia sp.]
MTPVGRLILIRSFPRSQLVAAMTYMTLPAVVGPVIGPLLGGFLTTYASWRWIFYVNVPFGLVGIVAALRFVEDIKGERPEKFDFPGFLMVGAGCTLLEFGLENIGRPTIPVATIPALIGVAVLLLLGFARYARNVSAPAVDLALFRLRSFRVGTLAGGICRIGLNGVPFVLPLMLQVGFGLKSYRFRLADLCQCARCAGDPADLILAVAGLWFRPRADRQCHCRRRGRGGLCPVAARNAASGHHPLCRRVRPDAFGPVHDLQHAVLCRYAGGPTQPRPPASAACCSS